MSIKLTQAQVRALRRMVSCPYDRHINEASFRVLVRKGFGCVMDLVDRTPTDAGRRWLEQHACPEPFIGDSGAERSGE